MSTMPDANQTPSIAIVGMSCRFPGADNPTEFWHNLRDGVESISRFTMEEMEASGANLDAARDPRYVPARAVLSGGASFDASFFGCSPREAEIMDPQHRVFLECAWEAMEDAGYIPGDNGPRVGVFAGASTNTYLFRNIVNNRQITQSVDGFQIFLGNDKDFIPTRVSYKLNLRGPSVAITTACSSSLVAVHFACQSLLSFQCDIALAGAVSIHSPEHEGYLYQEGGIHSPDGHCRAFDADAAGTIGGSGAGIVVLKRLEDAVADGDAIHGVIRGSTVNNDGSGKVGYTAPSVEGQAEAIAEAIAVANCSAESISYVEAHGTGTLLGDPIEIEALTRAFRRHTAKRNFCAIGSVKTNLGHLDAAAGMAGLIKTILSLKHRAIPASLHFRKPNPQVRWEETPFYVNAELAPWSCINGSPRRAGVSSFGIGGTNAHVILEEAPPCPQQEWNHRVHVLPLSARTPAALARSTEQLAKHLESNDDPLADVSFTLQTGRTSFPYRVAVTGGSAVAAAQALRASTVATDAAQERRVAFLFPGQGAQRPLMSFDLYRTEPLFRDVVDHCAKVLEPALGLDLRSILYPAAATPEEAAATLQLTQFAQPATFVVEYALANFLKCLGVQPHAMIGHSLGEYAAAAVAGVLSIESALELVALRGRLMSSLPSGAMLAVPLSQEEIAPWLEDGLALAAVNAPSRTVVSGTHESIAALSLSLERQGLSCKLLRTSHAFHSAMMNPILDQFSDAVRRMELRAPRVPYISNVSGTWITPEQATDPAYWGRHLRHTVRFGEGLATLMKDSNLILVQVGPGQELISLARRSFALTPNRTLLASDQFYDLMAQLWKAGVPIEWKALYKGERRRRVSLPTYPFERQRYYVRPDSSVVSPAPQPSTEDPLDWLYTPSWTRSGVPQSDERVTGPWLIFADDCGLANAVVRLLETRDFTVVTAGTEFARQGRNSFTIHPSKPEHYVRLLSELGSMPRRIVHLWTTTRQPCGDNLERGFYGVFHLLRALGEKGNTALKLHLISNGIQEVTGDETLHPLKGTVLAFVRVAPQEYPGLHCASVDIELPEAGSAAFEDLAARIASELRSDSSDPVIAFRGRHRWVQCVNPLVSRQLTPLPLGGAYLITGGTGGLGMEFATHLARTTRANLALVCRSPFACPPASVAIDLAPEEIASRERRIEGELGIRRLQSYDGLEEKFNRLCVAHILAYFRERGVSTEAARQVSVAALMRQLGVLPKFERFVHYFLRTLCEDGLARIEDGQITFLADVCSNADELSRALQEQYPGFQPTIALLAHCAARYGGALSGEVEAISVLFPDGKSGLMLEAGRDTVEHLNSRVYRVLLKDLLEQALKRNTGEKVRILEVGSGNGVLTGELLPILMGSAVEYHFTDLGRSFVLAAEAKAVERGFDFMRFGVLDIAATPESQGYTTGSFDFVLGLDVVHATPHIAQTLGNLRRFLKPGGTLALIETLRVARWNQMIFGLTEGWWNFEDPSVRQEGTPVLELETWQALLEASGYTGVQAFPVDPIARLNADSGLLIARNPAGAQPRTATRIAEMEALGSEVLLLQADVADARQMETAVAQTLERFGKIDGILHCAAVDDQGSIQWKIPRFAEMEFAPKIQGTEVLLGVAERTMPAFLLLCSSLNTFTGGAGQIGYCAANSYLDVLAHAQSRHSPTRVISVNWDRWQGIGLAAAFEEWHWKRTGKRLSGGMTVEQGLSILTRLLSGDTPPQVIVSKSPLDQAVRRSVRSVLQTKLPDVAAGLATASNGDAPHGPLEAVIAAVFAETLGVAAVGRHDNFAALGGDSLIAIQVNSRLRESLKVELPLRSLFEFPTVASLAERVANQQWATASQQAPLAGATEAEMEEGVL